MKKEICNSYKKQKSSTYLFVYLKTIEGTKSEIITKTIYSKLLKLNIFGVECKCVHLIGL